VVYLVLLLFYITQFVRAHRYCRQLRRTGLEKIDATARVYVEQMRRLLGIRKPVAIWISSLIESPVTIGFLKPVILVPAATLNHLTTEQLEAVLLHELAHIKRYDYLLHFILQCIQTILFFNPFVRLLAREAAQQREYSCDDWVLQFRFCPHTYATALLQLEQLRPVVAAVAMPAKGGQQHLLHRIRRMMNQPTPVAGNGKKLLSLLLLALLITVSTGLGYFNWQRPTKQPVVTRGAVQPYNTVPVDPTVYTLTVTGSVVKAPAATADNVRENDAAAVVIPALPEAQPARGDVPPACATCAELIAQPSPATADAVVMSAVEDAVLADVLDTMGNVYTMLAQVSELQAMQSSLDQVNRALSSVNWEQSGDAGVQMREQLEKAREELQHSIDLIKKQQEQLKISAGELREVQGRIQDPQQLSRAVRAADRSERERLAKERLEKVRIKMTDLKRRKIVVL
jgi:hypothetical protein